MGINADKFQGINHQLWIIFSNLQFKIFKQQSNFFAFIDEQADVTARLGQAQGLLEGGEGRSGLAGGMEDQSLQQQGLDLFLDPTGLCGSRQQAA